MVALVLVPVEEAEEVSDEDAVEESVEVMVVDGDVYSQSAASRPSFRVVIARFRLSTISAHFLALMWPKLVHESPD